MKNFEDYNNLNNIDTNNKITDESIDYEKNIIDCTHETKYIEEDEDYIDLMSEFTEEIEESKDIPKDINYTDNVDINEEISISESLLKKTNKKNKNFKKFKSRAAITLAAVVLCSGSIGLGLGVGLNTSKNFIASTDLAAFKFDNSKQASSNNNIMLTSAENSISRIIKTVQNSVVNISVKVQGVNFFNQRIENEGSGSGVIYQQDDEKVYIVTNNHVVDGAMEVTISVTGEEQVKAKLVGKDAQADLAVISVLKSDLQASSINEVTVANFADSDNLEVGETVIAIGNALGEGKTVTAGIISAQNKKVNIDGREFTVIQTDAAINPGNSGGALVNSNGEVIGINTAKLSSSAIEGIGYAIPSSVAKTVITKLMEEGTSDKPIFGIVGGTMSRDFMNMYNITNPGVFIEEVIQDSSAAQAGIKPRDIIIGFNGTKTATMEELSAAIGKCKVNDEVTVDIIRNGYTEMTLNAKLTNVSQQF